MTDEGPLRFDGEGTYIDPKYDATRPSGDCICTDDQRQGSGHGINCPQYRPSGDEALRAAAQIMDGLIAHAESWGEPTDSFVDDMRKVRAALATPSSAPDALRHAESVIRTLERQLADTQHNLEVALATPSSAPDVEGLFPGLPETALSVSRLARVFAAHFGPSYFPNMTDVTIHGRSPEEIAEQVAREYAALRDSRS
jgi:hypothetical protein